MDLATQLAKTCVASGMSKEALSPEETRGEFEDLEAKERIARSHAERLRELADERARREDTSPGGYASTFFKRLAPIPHTLPEAAVRLPATLGGGVGGYLLAKGMEGLNPEDVKKVVSPSTGLRYPVGALSPKGQRAVDEAPIVRALEKHFPGYGLDIAEAFNKAKGSDVAEFLRTGVAKGQLATDLGFMTGAPKERIKAIQEEVANLIRQGAKEKPVIDAASSFFRPKRMLGGLAGMAALGTLTGLPLAIRALYLKRIGGEAAARAQARMEEAKAEAEAAAAKREQLLSQLQGAVQSQ